MLRPRRLPVSSSPFLRAVSVSLVIGSTGCQLVFGDYAIDEGKGGQGGAAKGGSASVGGSSGSKCSSGKVQCTDAGVLQECQNGKWKTIDQCGDSSRCSVSAKQCVECESGQLRCNSDQKAVERCNDTRTGWEVEVACGPSEHCHAANLTCVECDEFDKIRCNDVRDRLVMCSHEGRRTEQICANLDHLCHVATDNGTDYCTACAVEGFSCSSDRILRECSNGREREITVCINGCNSSNTGCL